MPAVTHRIRGHSKAAGKAAGDDEGEGAPESLHLAELAIQAHRNDHENEVQDASPSSTGGSLEPDGSAR